MPGDLVPRKLIKTGPKARVAFDLGRCGETAVADAYAREGAVLRSERFRGGRGEIDLILAENGVLIFAEVKAAKNFEEGLSRVTPDKAARLFEAAQAYLEKYDLPQDQEMRFDIALVDRMGRVQIHKNAIWFD